MDYRIIDSSEMDALWNLQKLYKVEIGEDEPSSEERKSLTNAIKKDKIRFYGVWEGNALIGCCSITIGFQLSTICQAVYLRTSLSARNIAIGA